MDHGKTSLVRRITGTETDTLADEKSRGLSINLGFAYYHIPNMADGAEADLTVGFVDVPGHTDFINNALAGIGVADFAVLVVAADDGVMPQTREHLAIMNLLGIQGGAIVITKIDMASPQRLNEVEDQIKAQTNDTVFAASPLFAVSSQSGQGMAALVTHLEKLARSSRNQSPNLSQRARFTIDRSFTIKGLGTVVTGTVLSGQVSLLTTLVHSGSGEGVRIKGMRHDRETITEALAGERIALNINLPHHQVSRGDWLLDSQLYRPVNRIDTRLILLEPTALKSGVDYHFYHGTTHQLAQIRRLGDEVSPYYQLTSEAPFLTCYGDRFVLRDPACSQTIGGGIVVDNEVPRRGRNSESRLRTLAAMDQDDYHALQSLVENQAGGVLLERFARGRNCTAARLNELIGQLEKNEVPCSRLVIEKNTTTVLLHQRYLDQVEQRVLATLASYHQDNPGQAGVSEPNLTRLIKFTESHLLFHALIEDLITQGQVKRTGTLLHLPGHQARLSQEEQDFLDRIRPLLQDADFLPPRTRELAEMTGIKLGALERILASARKAGSLVQVANNRHYLPETMVKLAEFTELLARDEEQGFTVIQFRDRLRIGRNLCIEILEYFDRVGFTVRKGNSRHLRTARENIFGTGSGTPASEAATPRSNRLT